MSVGQDDAFEALAAIPDGECGACEQKFDEQDEAGPTLFDQLVCSVWVLLAQLQHLTPRH